ncbi:MAG: MBOAT family O-acyltransferase, partial [Cetobacterium sp.]
RNLLIVFLASGIWHGAGWNFIIWGALHGLAILIHRVWKSKGYKMPALLGWAITMFSVNIFWVFFRAKDLAEASKVLGAMIDVTSLSNLITENYKTAITQNVVGNKIGLICLVLSIFISFIFYSSHEKNKNIKFDLIQQIEIIFYLGVSIMIILVLKVSNIDSSFLYFNF